MKSLSLIAAIGYNNELGIDNHLLWKIPEDLSFYKRMTMGKNIIMGRKTFESMPPKAFIGRKPIILTMILIVFVMFYALTSLIIFLNIFIILMKILW